MSEHLNDDKLIKIQTIHVDEIQEIHDKQQAMLPELEPFEKSVEKAKKAYDKARAALDTALEPYHELTRQKNALQTAQADYDRVFHADLEEIENETLRPLVIDLGTAILEITPSELGVLLHCTPQEFDDWAAAFWRSYIGVRDGLGSHIENYIQYLRDTRKKVDVFLGKYTWITVDVFKEHMNLKRAEFKREDEEQQQANLRAISAQQEAAQKGRAAW